jgi:hypothetical protein
MTDPREDELLDEVDQEILDHLQRISAATDPPPEGLDELVGFAVRLEDIDREVARLAEATPVGASYRGDEDGVHTLTFEADSRAVIVTVVEQADGTVRLDGWVAPAAALRVELRLHEASSSRETQCDAVGGFVFEGVPGGLAQLVVLPAVAGEPTVVTPAFTL